MVHECIDNTQLMALRGACGIVLAPSEAEGFGHVLLEGMMSGGIVVTVDAPPMNELIRPDRGYLLPWSRSSQCRLGEAYYVDHLALEQTIESILAEDPHVLEGLSHNAWQWGAENHGRFLQRFKDFLDDELQSP